MLEIFAIHIRWLIRDLRAHRLGKRLTYNRERSRDYVSNKNREWRVK